MAGRAAVAELSFARASGVRARGSPSPLPRVTVAYGYAGFIDEELMENGPPGAGAEWMVTRHVAVRPGGALRDRA